MTALLAHRKTMTSAEMAQHIACISGGTIAHLFGVRSYADVDAAQRDWSAWVLEQPREWRSWPHAYVEYCKATGRAVVE